MTVHRGPDHAYKWRVDTIVYMLDVGESPEDATLGDLAYFHYNGQLYGMTASKPEMFWKSLGVLDPSVYKTKSAVMDWVYEHCLGDVDSFVDDSVVAKQHIESTVLDDAALAGEALRITVGREKL